MNPSRRSVLAGVGLTSAAALLSACGSSEGGSGAASSGATSSGSTDSFPVKVAHKYGTTEVKSQPKRVVCVGLIEQDTLLALDIVPVAVTAWLEAADGEIYPWAKSKLGSAALPTVLPATLSVEKVAAQKPDLILAIYSGLTKAQYQQLSKIAPTVAPAKGYVDYGTPWDVNAQMVADAVGKHTAGVSLIKGVKDDLAAAKKANPAFDGKTAIVVTPYEGVYIYGPQDPRSQIQKDLGFTYPAKFKDIGGSKSFGGSISSERAKQIDFDVVVWLGSEAEVKKNTGGLYDQTTAAKEGRTIYIPSSISDSKKNSTYASAFSFVSPLSIPWMLKRYVPQLAAAVDGKTSTKVPTVSE